MRALLAAVAILQAADILTTTAGVLTYGPGIEVGPLAAPTLAAFGLLGLALAKGGLTAALALVLSRLDDRRPRLARSLAAFVAGGSAAPVLVNLAVLTHP